MSTYLNHNQDRPDRMVFNIRQAGKHQSTIEASRAWRCSAAAEVFPQENRWKNPEIGEEGRHYIDESILQKAFKQEVNQVELTKRATCPYIAPFLRNTFIRSWI